MVNVFKGKEDALTCSLCRQCLRMQDNGENEYVKKQGFGVRLGIHQGVVFILLLFVIVLEVLSEKACT